jgi:hypothetical protein
MARDSCARYEVMAEVFTQTIEDIVQKKHRDYKVLKGLCLAYVRDLLNGDIDRPCMECDACMTFLETERIVYGYLFDGKDQKWVIEQFQHVKKARGLDAILRHLDSIEIIPTDYNRRVYESNHKLLVYLDHNVLDKYHKIEGVRNKLAPGYADVQYVYSPSHLEEIKRMKDESEEQQVLATIREVASSLFISNFEGNELSLAYEDPNYGWNRVLKNGGVAEDVENYRIIVADDRKVFYPQHTEQVHLRKLTFEQVYNHPMVLAVCEQFTWSELLDKNGRVKAFTSAHQAIHALVRALDNIGYKTEKKRGIRSSAHDIEHMIYAAGADILVTMDGTFKERSRFIYKRLGISTDVMDWKEYAVYVDSLNGLE